MNLTDKQTLTSEVWMPTSVFEANDSKYVAVVVYERLVGDIDEADVMVSSDFFDLADPTLELEFLTALTRSVNTTDKLGCTIGAYRVEIQRTSYPATSDGIKRPHQCFNILMYKTD